ncbi:hypothetical protein PL81_12390 [Streptomyces sp. RSD-27]|nr:hypothetical protein PL81_12390 [Streptomyces sp. RSD-27]
MAERTTAPRSTSTSGVSSAQARGITRELLSKGNPVPGREEDVLTAVSELIANAKQHAGGVSGFQVASLPGAVLVEVSDPSPEPPVTRPWAPTRPGGFGWRLVNQLADKVTVTVHDGGKTIAVTCTSRG